MKKHKFTTSEMELTVVAHFNPRASLIVPNVSWGMGLHECDLLILTTCGYAYEIEIKVSKADLIKDAKKTHAHKSDKIKFLYFAVPDYLLPYKEHIPERAGIIKIFHYDNRNYCEVVREPTLICKYKFSDEERYDLARLGALRIWNLKRKIMEMKEINNKQTHAEIRQ